MNFVNLYLFIRSANYSPMRLREFYTLRLRYSGGKCISHYRCQVLTNSEICPVLKLNSRTLSFSPVRLYTQNPIRKVYNVIKENISLVASADERNELAIFLYRTIDGVNFEDFYTFLDMPDTFHSWFVVVELHVWMLLSQLMDRDKACLKLRNAVVKAMWHDVEGRLKHIGKVNTKIVKKQLKELSGRLPVALWVYDEGLLGTDTILAGAIWYKFFDKQCSDPRQLEILVRYVRHQIQHLALLNMKDYDAAQRIKNFWLPFTDHVKAVTNEY